MLVGRNDERVDSLQILLTVNQNLDLAALNMSNFDFVNAFHPGVLHIGVTTSAGRPNKMVRCKAQLPRISEILPTGGPYKL